MDKFLGVVIVALVIMLFVSINMWHFSRSREVLRAWADDSGFEILHSEYRFFLRGKFFWTASKGQTVYRVKVRDSDGRIRSGWVRCGGFWLGLLSDHAEARWDD